jgi:hypothetical protein
MRQLRNLRTPKNNGYFKTRGGGADLTVQFSQQKKLNILTGGPAKSWLKLLFGSNSCLRF